MYWEYSLVLYVVFARKKKVVRGFRIQMLEWSMVAYRNGQFGFVARVEALGNTNGQQPGPDAAPHHQTFYTTVVG